MARRRRPRRNPGAVQTEPTPERRKRGRPKPTEPGLGTTELHGNPGKKRLQDDVEEAPADDDLAQKRPRRSLRNTGDENTTRALLTWKNLKLLEKMGKKSGSGGGSTLEKTSTTTSASSKTTTSTTTSGFAVDAIRNGILPVRRSKAPENIAGIRQRYGKTRETASPTESMYEYYLDSVQTAANEATMVTENANDLLKRYPKEGYKKTYNQAFTGLPKDVGFNTGLSAPQPDFVEGLLVEEFEPFPIATHIRGGELFKDNPHSLAVPHIAGEWKGPGKNMELARLQSSYDGAALVYGRQQALSHLDQQDPPGRACITTFTTDGTHLNMFAHYAEAGAQDDQTKYHQYPVKSVNLLESYESFKDGRRGLRNEQDHAREQSYALRDQLKERWAQEEIHRNQLRANYNRSVADEHPSGTALVCAAEAEENPIPGKDIGGVRGRKIKSSPQKMADSTHDQHVRKGKSNKRKEPEIPAPVRVRRSARLTSKGRK